MAFTHECRFKKHFGLEKNWIMGVDDIVEVTGLDREDLQAIYLTTLATTRSRSRAINEVCGYAMKRLFPHKKDVEEDK
jgi:hypothetical protein